MQPRMSILCEFLNSFVVFLRIQLLVDFWFTPTRPKPNNSTEVYEFCDAFTVHSLPRYVPRPLYNFFSNHQAPSWQVKMRSLPGVLTTIQQAFERTKTRISLMQFCCKILIQIYQFTLHPDASNFQYQYPACHYQQAYCLPCHLLFFQVK